jgi:hypothetical protein
MDFLIVEEESGPDEPALFTGYKDIRWGSADGVNRRVEVRGEQRKK